MSTALSVLQTAWLLVLLVLAISRPIVSICDDYAEVACTGDPSDEWINSNLLGPSLPPAGTIAHQLAIMYYHVCVREVLC